MTQIHIDQLLGQKGARFGPTEAVTVDQERVDLFAEATGDFQWIHTDVERARRESPFGGPIAHGYLTLSLVNLFLPQLIEVTGASMGVNVGVERVRFPSPVPVGSQLEATAEVVDVGEVKGGIQLTVRVTVTIPGADKPACVVDTVSRFFP